jgi:hypothetical protein
MSGCDAWQDGVEIAGAALTGDLFSLFPSQLMTKIGPLAERLQQPDARACRFQHSGCVAIERCPAAGDETE